VSRLQDAKNTEKSKRIT